MARLGGLSRRTYPCERMSRYWKKQKAHTAHFLKVRAEYMARAQADGTYKKVGSRAVYLYDGTRLPALNVDGKPCTRKQARWFWRQARFEATLTMKKLIAAGIVSEDEVQGNKALHYVLSVMKAPVDQKIGLQAARTVLEWTRPKPVSKSEVTINKAEEWLEAVTSDNERIPPEVNETDAGDAKASS
jgi:hypothetical protein